MITLADFVAGAVRTAHTKKNRQFMKCIGNVVTEERITTWREIKSGKP